MRILPAAVSVVDASGAMTQWEVDHSSSGGRHRVVLRSADAAVSAESWHVFDCLRQLREQLEPNGFRVCVNGSRRDAYETGMAADMSEGFAVVLMTDSWERPPIVDTYGFASPDLVVTLAEQAAAFDEWSRRPKQERPLPASLTPDEAYRAACHLVHFCAREEGADPALLALFIRLWHRHQTPGDWNRWRLAMFSAVDEAGMSPTDRGLK